MWTIGSASSVAVTAGDSAELLVDVTNDDPGPGLLRGSVRVIATPPSISGWVTVDRSTRSVAPGATERFSVTIAVPADASPGSRSLDVFVVVTDDPSADTTAHCPPVAVVVSAAVPPAIAADRSEIVLQAGQTSRLSLQVTGRPGLAVQVGLVATGALPVPGWFAVEQPDRVLGVAPEVVAVTLSPPTNPGANTSGRFAAALSVPPEPAPVVRSAPVAWSIAPGFGRVIATVPIGAQTSGVALSPDGRWAYVTHGVPLPQPGPGFLKTVDTASCSVVGTVQAAKFAGSVAVSPDGARVYVANLGTTELTVVDTAQGTARTLAGVEVEDLAVSPDGHRIWVTTDSDTLTELDAATGAVVAVAVGLDFAMGLAMSPDGSRVYVSDVVADALRVIDTASASLLATIPVGADADPFGVAVSPDGRRVFVANGRANTVSVIDAAAGAVVATVPDLFSPRGVAVTPDGRRVYVTDQGRDTVSVIDVERAVVATTVQVGRNPIGVAVSRDGRRVYVANEGSGTLSVLAID